MNDFKPKLQNIPLSRFLAVLCVLILIDMLFNDGSPTIKLGLICLFYLIGELIYIGYKRYTQIINHRRLKSYGLSVAWLQHSYLHTQMRPVDFMGMWESSLCNYNWRQEFVNSLQQAEFYCIYDTMVSPNRLRWNLDIILPDKWNDDNKLSAVITLMTGLPEDQPWRVYRDENKIKIETYMYEVDGAVLSFEQNPAPASHFWYVFQNDLIWLLDQVWSYNTPLFKPGVVDHIWFELPAKFPLPNNGYLYIESEDNKIKATAFNSDGLKGESVLYNNQEECWSVWRHAVDMKEIDL